MLDTGSQSDVFCSRASSLALAAAQHSHPVAHRTGMVFHGFPGFSKVFPLFFNSEASLERSLLNMAFLAVLETSSNRLERILGLSWGQFGAPCGRLGASWGRLGASWGHLGLPKLTQNRSKNGPKIEPKSVPKSVHLGPILGALPAPKNA